MMRYMVIAEYINDPDGDIGAPVLITGTGNLDSAQSTCRKVKHEYESRGYNVRVRVLDMNTVCDVIKDLLSLPYEDSVLIL